MKTIDEELLMAHADGELDAETASELQPLIDADPALAARLRRHRALRERLQAAGHAALDEPVPERLLHAAMATPAPAAAVIDLASRRAARALPPRRPGWAAWGGLAASLLVGVLVGVPIGQLTAPAGNDEPFASSTSGLVARGAIADALTTRVAGPATADRRIALQISFVDADGRYCRTFSMPALAGLACRDGADWAIQSLLQTGGAPQTEMRQAASALPQELLEMVDRRISGPALDAGAERAAVQRGWQR